MNSFNHQVGTKKKLGRLLFIGAVICVVALICGLLYVHRTYRSHLQPVGSSQNVVSFTIPQGATAAEIATLLEQQSLIQSSWSFEWYVRSNNVRQSLQAGTYALRPNMGVEQIVEVITLGNVATELVTILPASRIDQIEQSLIASGFNEQDVKNALNPVNYKNHPALIDLPANANTLEGYLFPESFQKSTQTSADEIVTRSLNEMHRTLTAEVRAGITAQGLTVHEGVILASIIEQEVSNPDDKPLVAQVFIKRLNDGMALESDATAPYGAILNGQQSNLTYDSPYNTYLYSGLPPTPISNVSASSLKAVANPSSTEFVYFVSGDDGTTHFSETFAEHQANINAYCTTLCGR